MSKIYKLMVAAMAGLALLLASGCTTVAKDYAGTQPSFDLRTFFNGPVRVEGIFQERSGKVVNRIYGNLMGHWTGDTGTLEEHFAYLDGTPDQMRVWKLRMTGPHTFEGTAKGTAGDIVGTATGEGYGFALHWSYVVNLPVGDSHYNLHFDDWMYMLNPTTVVNRSTVTKFGIRLGEATLFFHKLPDTPENRRAMSTYPSK